LMATKCDVVLNISVNCNVIGGSICVF
jgi:hypothetical protein